VETLKSRIERIGFCWVLELVLALVPGCIFLYRALGFLSENRFLVANSFGDLYEALIGDEMAEISHFMCGSQHLKHEKTLMIQKKEEARKFYFD